MIDGDFMGQVHWAAIGEANLTALWGNYAALEYRRLVYTNTVSVLDGTAGKFRRAMGADGREIGSELANSARKARLLDDRAPVDTNRVVTDGRSVVDIAEDVLAATGWVNRP